MPVPAAFTGRFRVPVIAAPMFLVSGPELVIACCTSGVAGTFPSLNARPASELEVWLSRIEEALAAFQREHPDWSCAPYGVNLIVHHTNSRLQEDLACIVAHRVPFVITSLGNPKDIVEAVHGYGGLVFHDVMVGEVWLAGGQSNMELELRNSEHADEALEDCADPLLRFYNVPKTGVINRNAENASSWQESSPENSGVMSAVAYYFARKLRSELDPDLPVGIVDCYIGGTSISCWMSEDALNSSDAGRGSCFSIRVLAELAPASAPRSSCSRAPPPG